MAQSFGHPTSAQIMISWFVSSSPTLGSVLTAQSLEPASDSVFPSFSAPHPLTLCLYQKMHKHLKKFKKGNIYVSVCVCVGICIKYVYKNKSV